MGNTTNQYYTPELWELCHGFEVEIFTQNESWQKWVINVEKGDIEYLYEVYFPEKIRVKSIDREDIESLGYYENKKIENEFCPNETNAEYIDGIIDHYIILHPNWKVQIDTHYETVYYGKIRNKFHLSQILKDIA